MARIGALAGAFFFAVFFDAVFFDAFFIAFFGDFEATDFFTDFFLGGVLVRGFDLDLSFVLAFFLAAIAAVYHCGTRRRRRLMEVGSKPV